MSEIHGLVITLVRLFFFSMGPALFIGAALGGAKVNLHSSETTEENRDRISILISFFLSTLIWWGTIMFVISLLIS